MGRNFDFQRRQRLHRSNSQQRRIRNGNPSKHDGLHHLYCTQCHRRFITDPECWSERDGSIWTSILAVFKVRYLSFTIYLRLRTNPVSQLRDFFRIFFNFDWCFVVCLLIVAHLFLVGLFHDARQLIFRSAQQRWFEFRRILAIIVQQRPIVVQRLHNEFSLRKSFRVARPQPHLQPSRILHCRAIVYFRWIKQLSRGQQPLFKQR